MKPATIRARVQQVFVVDGVRPITERTATIIVSQKRTWAEVYDRRGVARRKLLGTKAFFTRQAAEVRKLGELRKLAATFLPDYMGGNIHQSARQQLATWKTSGVVH